MHTLKNKKKNGIFFDFIKVIMFLYFLFSVSYKFIPAGIPTSYIFMAVFIICALIYSLKTGGLILSNRKTFLFSIMFLVVSAISYVINAGSADEFMMRTALMYVIMSVVTGNVVALLFKNDYLKLLKSISYVGVINGIAILTMLLIKPFQTFYLSLLSEKTFSLIGGAEAVDGLISLRMVGITGFSAYATGFVQCLCAICYVYYMFLRDGRIALRLKDYFVLGIIFMSALIAARSSLVGIALIIFLLAFNMNSLRFMRTLMLTLVLVLVMLTVVISFIPQELRDFFVNWISEFFISGTKTGSLQTNISMYIYGLSDFSLFGDSRWYGDNNDYYMNTDVGWYRLPFAIGFIGSITWGLTLLSTLRFSRLFSSKIAFPNAVAMVLFLYVSIMMFKGAIVFDSFQSILIFLVIDIVSRSGKHNET